jgi:hypothetical protein
MNLIKSTFKSLYSPCSKYIHERWAVLFPKCYAGYVYKKNFNRKLNLKDPVEFNEKVQWLKVYSDISEWTNCSDKYKAREFVTEKGLEENLTELYGVWERADEIDFSVLPEKFVLKTNSGYGHVILVKDKSKLDMDETVAKLNGWVGECYGLVSFEPHYWNIERRIIAEEYLQDEYNANLSSSLIDYKFYCINGEPHTIEALYDRNVFTVGAKTETKSRGLKACAFDLDWNPRTEIYANRGDHPACRRILKPKRLDEMLRITRVLSESFPQVRVDLYEVDSKIFFGELTFTPGGGLDVFNWDYFLEMGNKLDLSGVKPRTKRSII